MAESKMTLIGLERWVNYESISIFDKMELPEGVDKETLVNNILLRGGEFEVVWADPYFIRDSIEFWSKKWFRTFDKWVKALELEYNPLDNYDRFEEWSDTGSHSSTGTNTNTGRTTDSTSGSGTVEDKKSAFDSSSYEPLNKSETNNRTSSETSLNTTNNSSDSGNTHSEHTGRIHGNIGVTTSMKLLSEELELVRFNLIEQITDIFLKEYVLPIY